MATQTQRRARTREAVLDAAEALIQKQGFDATSVDQITERAGVAKGTFYQHFDTKLDVLLALTRRQQEALTRKILAAMEQGQPPLEAGRKLVRAMARWCQERGPVAGELILRALERPEDAQESSVRRLMARILELAQQRGEIRTDVPAAVMAVVITGAMVPSMVYWSRNPEKGNLSAWLEQTWKLTLEGALPRGGARR